MPGKLKVKIVAGRHLPVMDRASDLTDAFVEVKFGNTTFKTDVRHKSLNPLWNSEWFKFEVDDEELQDEPLQITVLDHDTYSANDAIGRVYIDIDPLLTNEAAHVISGWFLIFDTIHGIRGEINITIKVDLFNDLNRFRQSSCGVKFFSTTCVPWCYRAVAMHGFVEELVVNEDPEYQWIDRIRTPRASNEARQRLISQMSGALQRKLGLKVLEMGGNAVLGYLQCFDLEGETGLVVRAIGTACTLEKLSGAQPNILSSPQREPKETANPEEVAVNNQSSGSSSPRKIQTFSFSPPKPSSRRSSSSDTELSLTPKTGVGSGSGSREANPAKTLCRQLTQTPFDQREYPFFTLTSFPPGFLVHVAGVVSARSVKLLDRIYNPDEPETRDAWWAELRQEIRSHARALGCHAVIGYSEHTSICEEVCILSASGTAAILNSRLLADASRAPAGDVRPWPGGSERRETENGRSAPRDGTGPEDSLLQSCCICHVPYDELNLPFPMQLALCASCHLNKVPDVLFTTIELPHSLAVIGKGCLIQARLCRQKKKAQGEVNAATISGLLPFMEYELHTQLMSKLKLRGMNALFGLRVHISVGETMLVGVASATAVFVAALPPPGSVTVAAKTPEPTCEGHLATLQRHIDDLVARNRQQYKIILPERVEEAAEPSPEPRHLRMSRSQSESSEEMPDLDLAHGRKDAFVIEIDDVDAEEDVHMLLMDTPTPPGFYICNTETVPGVRRLTSNLQMFTAVRMYSLNSSLTAHALNRTFNSLCDNLLKSLFFKLRSMTPCCLCHVNFSVSLPEDELVQVTVTSLVAACARDSNKDEAMGGPKTEQLRGYLESEDPLQFPLELTSEAAPALSPSHSSGSMEGIPGLPSRGAQGTEMDSPHVELRQRHRSAPSPSPTLPPPIVELTPLSFVAGHHVNKYLGIINVFFIRETTSLREEGGVSGFLHTFLIEVFSMVRAHVVALGGNAVVSYRLKECVFMENLNKNQAQCLVNVSGDAVHVVCESDSEVDLQGASSDLQACPM
uniref:C2 domain-containing protein 5 isoform X2 n=1 Tax=Myxine glutinosa TaxID=7769 RepID=UPI00358E4398